MSDFRDDVSTAAQEYLTAAIKFGETQTGRDFEAGNEFADALQRLGRVLRRSPSGQDALMKMLADQNVFVRLWAGGDALAFAPEMAVPVLEAIAAQKGLTATDARMTLSEWRAGRLLKD
jgi:hypothetical protein